MNFQRNLVKMYNQMTPTTGEENEMEIDPKSPKIEKGIQEEVAKKTARKNDQKRTKIS